ncbi:transmembrane, (DUF594), partial [Olea europaea subsp. europaea]
ASGLRPLLETKPTAELTTTVVHHFIGLLRRKRRNCVLLGGVSVDSSLLRFCRVGETPDTMAKNCEFSKWISDYMLYLLVMRPTLMSTVEGIAKIRYQDTCEEAKKYFLRWQSELHSKTNESWLKFACAKLHSVNTLVKPNEVRITVEDRGWNATATLVVTK